MSVRSVLLSLLVAFLGAPLTTAAQPPTEPSPVRHDIPQAGTEFLVLRHQRLIPGSHEAFYAFSRDGVWPLYEKIGTRVVGQWQVVDPVQSNDWDGAYRLARYRSFNHWAATRGPWRLAGNGGDLEAGLVAIAARNKLLLGSDGPIFLEGPTTPQGPYYFPALDERYRAVGKGEAEDEPATVFPTRHAAAVTGTEIVTLRYFKIAKGSFEEFHRLSRDGVWPYFEKMGARIVGQWKVVYPIVPEGGGEPSGHLESADWDEAFMMVRYVSREHWEASRPGVMHRLGGDGPDFEACVEALDRRRALTVESTVEFLVGHFYDRPPIFTPALAESWNLSEN